MWPSTSIPDNWLLCDGTNFVTANYPDLYAILGNSNELPDFTGRMPIGAGEGTASDATERTLGDMAGTETHTLSIGEMPSHSHDVTVTYREGEENGSGNAYSDLGGGSSHSKTFTTTTRGGDQAHNNMPPHYTINFIIKAR